MTALIRGACCAVGLLLLLASTAGTAQNQLPTVFARCDTVKLADGIYAVIPAEDASALVSGNSVLIFGSDGALVVDSGHVPSVTKRMIADIIHLANQPSAFVNTYWHPDHVTGNTLYRDQ
jgi:glyoxylase-like metal-dependent hydrolase (beta-lactamase superfamily II)